MPAEWRALHHDVAGALQVAHSALGGVVLALAAARPGRAVPRWRRARLRACHLQTLGETYCGILALIDETFLRVGSPACRVSLRARPRGPSSLVRRFATPFTSASARISRRSRFGGKLDVFNSPQLATLRTYPLGGERTYKGRPVKDRSARQKSPFHARMKLAFTAGNGQLIRSFGGVA
jgi:hypothetical protein